MKKLVGIIAGFLSMNSLLLAQTVLPLYDKVPNSKPSLSKEKSVVTDGILRISKVSEPTITMYQPTGNVVRNTTVIICPGGGYGILAASHEGSDVAKVLNEWGITAFVLKYRLPDDSMMFDLSIGPLQDVQRAIQLVRENATTWELDPDKIGVMGFSAGGHLAATASTKFNEPVIDNPKAASLRPDFSILAYPVISFTDSLTHMGSRNNLIGKEPTVQKINAFSNELLVTAHTPPAFLVHASDDKAVKVGNSIRYYEALIKNNVSVEMHLYKNGGHGFGMNNKTTSDSWMERLKNWMMASNFL
jgi:acetyl esterase/lipase